jgi:hypothetical protein
VAVFPICVATNTAERTAANSDSQKKILRDVRGLHAITTRSATEELPAPEGLSMHRLSQSTKKAKTATANPSANKE